MSNLTSTSQSIVQSLGLSNDAIYSLGLKILRGLSNRGSILDFGSGQGRFLSMLSDLKFKDITGADLMDRPAMLPSNIKWIQSDLNKELPISPGSYDVIVAIEVIEHLENPRAMIRDLYKLLSPGGYLILSTPNNESIRAILALALKGHFVSFLERDYPAHITALVGLDLKRILEENKFKKINFKYVSRGAIPLVRMMTWQHLSFGILQGKRFSDNVFVVAQK